MTFVCMTMFSKIYVCLCRPASHGEKSKQVQVSHYMYVMQVMIAMSDYAVGSNAVILVIFEQLS